MAWEMGHCFFMVTWVYLIVKGDMEMYNSSEIFDFSIRPRDICGNDVIKRLYGGQLSVEL